MQIPNSVVTLGGMAFYKCKSLKRVSFQDGSKLQRIGRWCFEESALEEFSIPGSVVEISWSVFSDCTNLKAIYVEDCFGLSLKSYSSSLTILPSRKIRVGTVPLWDLRALRDVRIPEGIERIGNYWFSYSEINSIEIAASVRKLDLCAFYRCSNLKNVMFTAGSRLEEIGVGCFGKTGIKSITIPSNVTLIGECAFYDCGALKQASFEIGSKLEKLENASFYGAALEQIVIPKNV